MAIRTRHALEGGEGESRFFGGRGCVMFLKIDRAGHWCRGHLNGHGAKRGEEGERVKKEAATGGGRYIKKKSRL